MRKGRCICDSGLEGWYGRLRDQYRDFEDFENWNQNYGLAERLGYGAAETAWEANPVIEGSVKPSDYRRREPELRHHVYKKYRFEAIWTFDSTHTTVRSARAHAKWLRSEGGWACARVDSTHEAPSPRFVFID